MAMNMRKTVRWLVAFAVTVSVTVTASSSAVVLAEEGLGAGGELFPLTPTRIYDSRAGSAVNEPSPGPKQALPSAPTFDIPLLGQGGVPSDPSRVLAVVVNITVTDPTSSGWLSAFATGAQPATPSSIINFVKARTVPNLTIVRPGTDGRLTIQLFSIDPRGSANVIVDVFGWIATSSNPDRGARLIPVTPARLLDTRSTSPVRKGESIELAIRGASSGGVAIPSSADVTGVVLNVTGINDRPASSETYVSVVADPLTGAPPTTSNLNLARGLVKPNLVIVPVNAVDGKVRIYNHSGEVDLAVDVVGYLQQRPDATRAGRIVPLAAPFRAFDTREAAFGSVELGPGEAERWSFADFAASVNIGGVSVGNQMAVIGNLTVASLRRQVPTSPVSGYLSVFPEQLPAGQSPSTSNLNMVEGVAVPTLALVMYGPSATTWVYNFRGLAHYLFDASAVVLAD